MNEDLVSYYKDRANEYEKIYLKPERQADLQTVTEILQDIFKGKKVFEIACGTGYWTQRIAATATSIMATDINETVITVARTKKYFPAEVTFEILDIHDPDGSSTYENLFGGFIWSHIKKQDLPDFINSINKNLNKGGTVVFIDNNYVEGSNLPITDIDKDGNTYQTRVLENGEHHSVLKNFPTIESFKNLLAGKVENLEIVNLEYFWILKYTVS